MTHENLVTHIYLCEFLAESSFHQLSLWFAAYFNADLCQPQDKVYLTLDDLVDALNKYA